MTAFATADLSDEHGGEVRALLPGFMDYGAKKRFCGPVATLKVHEDNSLVRAALEQRGEGRVLVVDGGGSMRCALLGDNLARLARDNGWQGVVISGCIRDSAAIAGIELGVKALGTHPSRSHKRGEGERDVPVSFAGVTIAPGMHLYADEDGMLISERPLL
jgi:regulator of ribonuclease activity A